MFGVARYLTFTEFLRLGRQVGRASNLHIRHRVAAARSWEPALRLRGRRHCACAYLTYLCYLNCAVRTRSAHARHDWLDSWLSLVLTWDDRRFRIPSHSNAVM
ncbi:hypothetical protein J6590_000299 [Homalodisca vitripennis]|nr:hypothetical protein J6590_000299 [Homalodisca vitripennis]